MTFCVSRYVTVVVPNKVNPFGGGALAASVRNAPDTNPSPAGPCGPVAPVDQLRPQNLANLLGQWRPLHLPVLVGPLGPFHLFTSRAL